MHIVTVTLIETNTPRHSWKALPKRLAVAYDAHPDLTRDHLPFASETGRPRFREQQAYFYLLLCLTPEKERNKCLCCAATSPVSGRVVEQLRYSHFSFVCRFGSHVDCLHFRGAIGKEKAGGTEG